MVAAVAAALSDVVEIADAVTVDIHVVDASVGAAVVAEPVAVSIHEAAAAGVAIVADTVAVSVGNLSFAINFTKNTFDRLNRLQL